MTKSSRIVTEIFNVLEKVEKVTKLSTKLELLNKVKQYEEFKTLMRIVFSRNINTQTSYKKLLTYPEGDKQLVTYEDFLSLVGQLSKRSITGNKAVEAIKTFFLKCDKFHAKWYKRIIGKDLRAGFGEQLLKTLYGENVIEVRLECMLATSSKSVPKFEQFFQNHNWIVEPKIDGLRCLTVIKDGVVTCYSRNGKVLPSASKFLIYGLSEKYLKRLNGLVLDGEFYSKNWSKTMTSVFTKDINVSKYLNNVGYFVFDIIPLSAMQKKKYNKPLHQRKRALNKIFRILKHPFKQVPYSEVKNMKTVYEYFDGFMKQGFEGAIIKNINSPYVCKRSKDWIKVKKVETIDVLCTGIEKSYKNKDEISALYFKYKGKECRVGSGLTQHQRKSFLKYPDLVVGKIIEVEYQEESVDGCLRFPVFIRIRYDKEVPDA